MSKIQDNNTSLQTILNTINNLPEFGSGGIDTSDATATSEDIMLNEIAYANGKKITGSFTIDEEITTANELIDNINIILNSKVINNGGYDEFWDSFQDNGNRVNYEKAFCGFTNDAFKPKYDIKPTHVYGLFWGCPATIDLAARLEELGVKLDLSNCGSGLGVNYIFGSSKFIRIGVVDTRNMSNLAQTFQSCGNLITIDKLILKEDGSQSFTHTFTNDGKLENIVIEGKIGQDVSFTWSTKLTYDSLVGKIAMQEQIADGKNVVTINGTAYYGGILGALYDYSGVTTTHTLTLGTTNLAKLTDAEKAIATEKGWTLA